MGSSCIEYNFNNNYISKISMWDIEFQYWIILIIVNYADRIHICAKVYDKSKPEYATR